MVIEYDYIFIPYKTRLSGNKEKHKTITTRDAWLIKESNIKEMKEKAEKLKSEGFNVFFVDEEIELADVIILDPNKVKFD